MYNCTASHVTYRTCTRPTWRLNCLHAFCNSDLQPTKRLSQIRAIDMHTRDHRCICVYPQVAWNATHHCDVWWHARACACLWNTPVRKIAIKARPSQSVSHSIEFRSLLFNWSHSGPTFLQLTCNMLVNIASWGTCNNATCAHTCMNSWSSSRWTSRHPAPTNQQTRHGH